MMCNDRPWSLAITGTKYGTIARNEEEIASHKKMQKKKTFAKRQSFNVKLIYEEKYKTNATR